MESIEVPFRGSGGCFKHMCFAICFGVVLFVDMFFLIRIMKRIPRADCRFEWCCYEHVHVPCMFCIVVFGLSSRHFMFLAPVAHHIIRSALVEQSTPSSHVIVDEVASVSNISFTEPLVINIMSSVNIRTPLKLFGLLKLVYNMVSGTVLVNKTWSFGLRWL